MARRYIVMRDRRECRKWSACWNIRASQLAVANKPGSHVFRAYV